MVSLEVAQYTHLMLGIEIRIARAVEVLDHTTIEMRISIITLRGIGKIYKPGTAPMAETYRVATRD